MQRFQFAVNPQRFAHGCIPDFRHSRFGFRTPNVNLSTVYQLEFFRHLGRKLERVGVSDFLHLHNHREQFTNEYRAPDGSPYRHSPRHIIRASRFSGFQLRRIAVTRSCGP